MAAKVYFSSVITPERVLERMALADKAMPGWVDR